MLRALQTFVLAVSAGAAIGTAAMASDADIIRVVVDQAKIEKAPEGAVTLIVGNPAIADVSILRGGTGIVITGKAYGQTNFLALDDKGEVVFDKQIKVDPTRSTLVVQRGDQRISYACDPQCVPTLQMGDDPSAFRDIASQVTLHGTLAQGAAATTQQTAAPPK